MAKSRGQATKRHSVAQGRSQDLAAVSIHREVKLDRLLGVGREVICSNSLDACVHSETMHDSQDNTLVLKGREMQIDFFQTFQDPKEMTKRLCVERILTQIKGLNSLVFNQGFPELQQTLVGKRTVQSRQLSQTCVALRRFSYGDIIGIKMQLRDTVLVGRPLENTCSGGKVASKFMTTKNELFQAVALQKPVDRKGALYLSDFVFTKVEIFQFPVRTI